MADADKLSRVKEALLTLVNQLRETDTLSIVVFDSEAEVLRPARALGHREEVRRLIRQLEPGSSTNIHAGLVLGYKEALKHLNRKDAEHLLNAAVARTYQRYPNLEDEDISRTLLIAQKYQELLRKYNQEEQSRR